MKNRTLAVKYLNKRQNGAVLAVSLIMLLLLTIIGITGTQVTGLEEKMTNNMRERNVAFQAAETALRAGETFLTQAALPSFSTAGTNGLYNETGVPPKKYDNWASFNTRSYTDTTLHSTASAPRYIIQRLKNIGSNSSLDASNFSENELYRVTSRGVGGTSNSVVVLESFYKR
ncbi:pilus assembly PilX family protein [Methylomonas methanica]|uniref:Tfp pilus assembly protein PilX n=1 Tax=Methylomonas methanica (strain DSM 25384 / MC09) TaxID=857087 RepID=G0A6T1_METMM|nr:pilus assembly protein [Methylomonas methanica]AEG00552.1 Tfp pilus assembly protein PilX [Methylomonas methanica MC09]